MKKNYALSIILSSALLVLSGCGSSSSNTENSVSNDIEVVKENKPTVYATISKVNAAPVATFRTFSTNSGVVYNGLLTAEDRDQDNIEFKLESQPKHGRVTVNKNGTFIYTPEDGYVGKDSFSYVASDDISSCPVQSVEVEVAQKPITIPNAPTNLRLEALSTCKVKISWDDNSDNELGFDVYRDGELVSVEKANETTTNICGDMQPATSYHIEVKAKNEAGSSLSVSGDVTTKDITTPPIAPTNLEAKAVEENCVRLTWEDNAWSESAYEIYQDGKLIKTISSDRSCVTIKDLSPDSSYNFVVKAINKIGKSDSNAITVETEGVPVMTLVGGDEALVLGDLFTDKGATATDKEDGDLNVTVTGSVDTAKEGEYTITYKAVDKDANEVTAKRVVSVAKVSTEAFSSIPYDQNIELGGEEGVIYYADPRPEENGLNRALRVDYINWTFSDVNVSGVNPHSIDRAGDSNKFYMRTQNSHSFDVVNFDDNSVKTISLGAHKPRAIGSTNLKYNLQLLSVKNRAVVDVIDITNDTVIAKLGDDRDENITGEYNYDRSKLTSNSGSGSATGHSFWLDTEHLALTDRVNSKIVVYKVKDSGGVFSFTETSTLSTKTALHAIERVKEPISRDDLVTFYEMGEGDLTKGIDPYVAEIKFDPSTGKLTQSREVALDKASKVKVHGITPSTHHGEITPDGKYIYVPTFDSKVHIVERATMKVVKTLPAGLGAAHVTFSKQLGLAVITNHYDKFVTIIDVKTQTVKKDLIISTHEFHGHLLQPHFSYVSEDGKYYYTFDNQAGDFLKINLETLEIEDKLHTGGAPEQAHS